MKIATLIIAAICAYLIGGWNPAIEFSKRIYHKDIRTVGSGNAGFTNFKRAFGSKYAWIVFALDLTKAAIVVAVFSVLYWVQDGSFQLCAAITGAFAILGHSFPIWYGFKGGKGFTVYMSVIWFISWIAGLIAFAILAILLLTTRYMSVSTLSAITGSVIYLAVAQAAPPAVILICAAEVVFIIARHHANLVRLFKGTESKTNIFK